MHEIDVAFCFYDDPAYVTDADRDSCLLKRWHQVLWSKELPGGERLEWQIDTWGSLTAETASGSLRVSSDTIATTHANYVRSGVGQLWVGLGAEEQERFERAFYTIGAFLIFPTHPQSLNQLRGTSSAIADRFDLTLECIRQHYVGERTSPLSRVLEVDRGFFGLFGEGADGFAAYVNFFYLQDFVVDARIRWLDGATDDRWIFDSPALPFTESTYRSYLENVAASVSARNARIRAWCEATDPRPKAQGQGGHAPRLGRAGLGRLSTSWARCRSQTGSGSIWVSERECTRTRCSCKTEAATSRSLVSEEAESGPGRRQRRPRRCRVAA